jgi:hypothetical protein
MYYSGRKMSTLINATESVNVSRGTLKMLAVYIDNRGIMCYTCINTYNLEEY